MILAGDIGGTNARLAFFRCLRMAISAWFRPPFFPAANIPAWMRSLTQFRRDIGIRPSRRACFRHRRPGYAMAASKLRTFPGSSKHRGLANELQLPDSAF